MCKSSRLSYFCSPKPRHRILFSSTVDNFFHVFSCAYRILRRTRFSHECSSPLLRAISKTQTGTRSGEKITNSTSQETNLKKAFRTGTILIVSELVLIIACMGLASTLWFMCGPCHPMRPGIVLAVFVSGVIVLSGGIILQYRTERRMKGA